MQANKKKVFPVSSFDTNFWLDVDYLQAAKAAVACSAVFTGLFFAELWWELYNDSRKHLGAVSASKENLTASGVNFSSVELAEYYKLLASSFSRIAEPDSMQSITILNRLCPGVADSDARASVEVLSQTIFSSHPSFHQGYIHAGLLTQALETHGRWLTETRAKATEDVTLSRLLLASGHTSLLTVQLRDVLTHPCSNSVTQSSLAECYYESTWRQKLWHAAPTENALAGFHESILIGLASLHSPVTGSSHQDLLADVIKSARCHAMKEFSMLKLESTNMANPLLVGPPCAHP